MVWTAAWTDFVICLLFGWLGVHKFRERAILHGIVKILLSCLSMENIIFTRSEDK